MTVDVPSPYGRTLLQGQPVEFQPFLADPATAFALPTTALPYQPAQYADISEVNII